jgi:hypothetical protein
MNEIKKPKVDPEVEANLEKALESALQKARDNKLAMKVLKGFDNRKKDLGDNVILATTMAIVINSENSLFGRDALLALNLEPQEIAALEVHSFEKNPSAWENLKRTNAFRIKHFGRDKLKETLQN